jgi:superfamily II DNA/RNA helicase
MASSAQQDIFAALRGGVRFKSQGTNRSRGAPPKKGPEQPEKAPEQREPAFHSHTLRTEELSALRNARKIRVEGADAPSIFPDLAALSAVAGCPQQLLDNIAELGWTALTETQMQSIPALLDERDVLSIAPTGSGKTGAFAIPLLLRLLRGSPRPGAERSPRALILAPTRELATQIARETARLAKDTGISVRAFGKQDDVTAFAECDVLVSTPLRLATILTAQPGRRLAAVEILVVRPR